MKLGNDVKFFVIYCLFCNTFHSMWFRKSLAQGQQRWGSNNMLSTLEKTSRVYSASVRNLLKKIILMTRHQERAEITAIYNKFLFKEIKMVRVYTVWNLISSVGVIFGVFYGVSFMQVPDMVKALGKKVRRHISKKPSKRRKSKQFSLTRDLIFRFTSLGGFKALWTHLIA